MYRKVRREEKKIAKQRADNVNGHMKEMEKYKTMGEDLMKEVDEALKHLREIS